MPQKVTNPPTPQGDDGEQFLSNADLCRRFNKSRMTIHRWQKAGYLPAPVLIGGKLPATRLSELRAREASWPRARPAAQAPYIDLLDNDIPF